MNESAMMSLAMLGDGNTSVAYIPISERAKLE